MVAGLQRAGRARLGVTASGLACSCRTVKQCVRRDAVALQTMAQKVRMDDNDADAACIGIVSPTRLRLRRAKAAMRFDGVWLTNLAESIAMTSPDSQRHMRARRGKEA